MLEHMPEELREGMRLKLQRQARRSRLRVQIGEAVFPVIGLTDSTLSFDAEKAPRLRGLVDVFDGARHILQALIVANRIEGGLMICEFKRSTLVSERPALDYARDPEAPAGLLPRH